MGDGVIATNANDCITLMNTAACVLTGWTEQDAVGKPLRVVLHLEPPTDGPASDRGLPRQIRLVDRVGEVRTVACCRTPIRGSASDLPLGEVIERARELSAQGRAREGALMYERWLEGNGTSAHWPVACFNWGTTLSAAGDESGAERAGRWLGYRRNVLADYRRVFGGEPGRIRHVGLLADTDDLKTRTDSWFANLAFSAG